MNVTRSGYYAWRGREPSQWQKDNETLLSRIRSFFERSKHTYGSPRILRDLREAGFTCGKHRVARLMRQAGLRAVVALRFRVTTDSKHALPVAENRLTRNFGAPGPNVKWASDITYLSSFGRAKAGYILPSCWTCFRAALWAGPCRRVWVAVWWSML